MKMQTVETASFPALWFGMCLLAGLVIGCGGASEGPQRYRVSGTVTYKGQPVPYGNIMFTPDTAQGNSGPQGTAVIREGKFDTSTEGRDLIGGPHKLVITGYEREGSGDSEEPIPMLFSDYQMTLDLPKEDSTQAIEVPEK